MRYAPLFILLTLAGCAAPGPTVKSWMDPVSSATITAQSEPIILAGEGMAADANARDYAQLAAIEVNRMGDRKLYLVAILWNSFDRNRSQSESFETAFKQIEVRLDDRAIALQQYTGEIAELGVSQSQLPLPIPGSHQLYFPIERADLRALAQSNHVQLTAQGVPDAPRQYEEWQDGRDSLSDFLSQLPNESPAIAR